ncbi:dUTP diphosphatase [Pueribacillus sp. YX66]|uniref:dUTP diphosphatase n=1 Tax=Pueribacillus sp. YX66 TaxID=3229242 RepID=UPI00358D6517
MNLAKLFETQRKLDERIIEEKGLQGQNLLDKKILALQVELGELANEWRGFKFWSEKQEPNTSSFKCSECGFVREENIDCPLADEHYGFTMDHFNPLLEEYVDCLHFILSIGLEIEIKQDIFPEPIKYDDAVIQFNELFGQISYFASVLNRDNDWEEVEFEYERVWSLFFGLGGILGFAWVEIEQAYFEKNAENHRRQEVGY